MASLNKVFLMGNLTRDPDLRYTPSGQAVCDLGLAVNRRFVTNGQERDETCFVDIVVWGKAAENTKQYLEKGAPVMVEGRLQYDQWEDQSGGKRSRLRVVADQVQFLGGRRSQDGGGDYPQGGDYPSQGGDSRPQGNYRSQGGGNYSQQGNYQQNRGGYGPGGNSAPRAPQSGPGAPPAMPDPSFNPAIDSEDDTPF